jgi:hypothetical protein
MQPRHARDDLGRGVDVHRGATADTAQQAASPQRHQHSTRGLRVDRRDGRLGIREGFDEDAAEADHDDRAEGPVQQKDGPSGADSRHSERQVRIRVEDFSGRSGRRASHELESTSLPATRPTRLTSSLICDVDIVASSRRTSGNYVAAAHQSPRDFVLDACRPDVTVQCIVSRELRPRFFTVCA